LNLDLIFGVPGQSIETWQRTVEKTVSLAPEHISAYCLTFEEDTEFFRRFQSGEMTQDAEQDASFYEFTMANLATAGYSQYEISNYAKPGYECLHNLAYWLGRNYLGLGPSAFSTIGERRWQNTPDTSRYIEQLRSSIEPIGGMLYPLPTCRSSLLEAGRIGSAGPSNRSEAPSSFDVATRDTWFYFVASSARKSAWILVRQLLGPHLSTCA
jgi:hypothetical protein